MAGGGPRRVADRHRVLAPGGDRSGRAGDRGHGDPARRFKFISLAFLAGVPLRASWMKLTDFWKNAVFVFFTLQYGLMGLIYLMSDSQLCNNYLQSEQITLGWGFLTVAIALLIYLIQLVIIDPSDYE